MSTINKEALPESVRCLVNKTKVELLNIIARKDAVEVDLKNKLASTESKVTNLTNLQNAYNLLDKRFDEKVKELRDKNTAFDTLNEEYLKECGLREDYANKITDLEFNIADLEEKNKELATTLMNTRQNDEKRFNDEVDCLNGKIENYKIASISLGVLAVILAIATLCLL